MNRSTMWFAAWAAMLPWLAPTAVWAGPPVTAQAQAQTQARVAAQRTIDLELQAGGVVRGQVYNSEGLPAPGGDVKVYRDGAVQASAKVGPQGRFELKGLQPGACQLQLLTASQTCRLWAEGTAPPKAPRELLIVTGNPTARGQGRIGDLLKNPLFIGLVVAAAVAIPLALKDDSGS